MPRVAWVMRCSFSTSEADVAISGRAESDPGADRDLGLVEQVDGECERSHLDVLLGDLGPEEHRSEGLLDRPPGPFEACHEGVPTVPVGRDDLRYVVITFIEGDDRSDLDGLERAVVEIRLELAERRHHLGVPDDEADPPSRHRVTLGERVQLDADVHGTRHLEEARRLVSVEGDIGVREVVDQHDLVFLGERDEALEEPDIDDRRGRVVRK